MRELIFHETYRGDGIRVQEWPKDIPSAEANFAMELLRTNGILMGASDGEDTTGRAKMKAMEVRDLVKRACDVSQQLFAEFRERDMMIELPNLEEARDLARKERERN